MPRDTRKTLQAQPSVLTSVTRSECDCIADSGGGLSRAAGASMAPDACCWVSPRSGDVPRAGKLIIDCKVRWQADHDACQTTESCQHWDHWP
jgi:hypothetical protein